MLIISQRILQRKRIKKVKKKGFTLIELIIVIIGILAAIAVPKFSGIQKDAKIKADIASARVIGDATNSLIAEDKITGTYSTAAALGEDIKGYIQAEPAVKTGTGGSFKVLIDTTGNVVVSAGSATVTYKNLYPIPDLQYGK